MNICIAHGGDLSQPTGGTDRVTAFAGGLADAGREVTLVVPEPDGELPARLENVDVRAVDPTLGGVTNAATRAAAIAKTAIRTANERDATLQIEHSTLAGVATLFGAEGFVLDMHDLAHPRYDHVDSPVAPIMKRTVAALERRGLRRASHVVTVSERMGDLLVRRWDLDRRRLRTVPNGYFPETIGSVPDVDVAAGRVGFLGTLHPKVDVGAFVDLADHPLVEEVIVVGDGARRGELEERAVDHDAIRVTGRLPDAEAFGLLAGSAVLVNPQTESALQRCSSPVKLCYYAALGRPMVVSAGPRIVEELVAADAAVAAADRTEFVEGVERVLRDADFASALAERAASAAEQFRWSDRVAELDRVYDRLGPAGSTDGGGRR